jgi:hypothetical protein
MSSLSLARRPDSEMQLIGGHHNEALGEAATAAESEGEAA